jgi:hypothetical protein
MAVRIRTMDGIASRLQAHHNDRQHKTTSEIRVPYRQSSIVDLDAELGEPAGTYGHVRVWRTVVLNPKESNPAREFAPSSAAEMWTLNGQTHHTRSDRHFAAKRIGLDGLQGHLVVEVELDGLSADAKSLIVATTRTSRAHRAIGARMEQAIDQVIHDDDHLQELNQQIREEAFKKASEQRIAGLDNALRAFGLFLKRKKTKFVDVIGPLTKKAEPTINVTPPPPISPLHPHPKDVFQFRTAFRSTIHVKRGGTATVQLEVDATDGYFDGAGTTLSLQFVPDLGEKLRVVSQDALQGGRMRIWLRSAKDAPLVATKLIASCLPANAAAPFSAAIPVEIVEAKPRRTRPGTGKRRQAVEVEEDAPPPVVVAYENDAEHSWQRHGLADWTVDTIGEYKKGIAFVNGDYTELASLRDDLPKERHADITNIYVAPVGMTIVGLEESQQSAPNEVELHPHYRDAALKAAALSSLFAIKYMNNRSLIGGPDEGD